MKKILILQNILPHYRKPFYNFLARSYDVTLLHSGKPCKEREDAFVEILAPARRIGPWHFQGKALAQVRSGEYDAVIAMFDVNWPMNLFAYWLRPRAVQFIWWGIGVSKSRWANLLKKRLVGPKAQLVLYNAEGRRRMMELGVPPQRLHVGNNTFHVPDREPCHLYEAKDLVLFVGTLMPRKQADILVAAFAKISGDIPSHVKLAFVGAGGEEIRLRTLVREYGLDAKVIFTGAIDDPVALTAYYRRALVSVSFGQAGLSVLQSLAYGVPFLTKRSAISGGEIYNIVDGHNGILCEDSLASLADNLGRFCREQVWARSLGRNAYDHYSKYCTLEVMAGGFRDALEAQTDNEGPR